MAKTVREWISGENAEKNQRISGDDCKVVEKWRKKREINNKII